MKQIGILFGILFISICLIVTGCGKKVLTAEDFKIKLESYSYKVDMVAGLATKENGLLKALYASPNNKDNIRVWYFMYDTKDSATSAFDIKVKSLEDIKDSASTTTKNDADLITKYTFSNNDSYVTTTRIDNTIITIEAGINNKKNMDSLMSELGY